MRPQRESSEFAHECLKGSHIVSPREAFLRASTYWKTGQFSTAKTRDSSKCTSVTSAGEGITSGIWPEERTPLDNSLAGCPRTTPNLAPVRRPVAHFPAIRWATRRITTDSQLASLELAWNRIGDQPSTPRDLAMGRARCIQCQEAVDQDRQEGTESPRAIPLHAA